MKTSCQFKPEYVRLLLKHQTFLCKYRLSIVSQNLYQWMEILALEIYDGKTCDKDPVMEWNLICSDLSNSSLQQMALEVWKRTLSILWLLWKLLWMSFLRKNKEDLIITTHPFFVRKRPFLSWLCLFRF